MKIKIYILILCAGIFYDASTADGVASSTIKIDAPTLLEQQQRNAFKAELTNRTVNSNQKIEEYIATSIIPFLFCDDKKKEVISMLRSALQERVIANNNQWPSIDKLEMTEHFFWNYYDWLVTESHIYIDEISDIFASNNKIDWHGYLNFCRSISLNNNASSDRYFLKCYANLENDDIRNGFINYCNSKRCANVRYGKDFYFIYLPAYKMSLTSEEDEHAFLDFWNLLNTPQVVDEDFLPFYNDIKNSENKYEIINLVIKLSEKTPYIFALYRTLNGIEDVNRFVDFFNEIRIQPNDLKKLIPIYRTFSTKEEFNAFVVFCKTISQDRREYFGVYLSDLIELFPIYNRYRSMSLEKNNLIYFPYYQTRHPEPIISTYLKCLNYQDMIAKGIYDKVNTFYKNVFQQDQTIKRDLECDDMGCIALTIYNAFDTPFERAAYLSFRKNIVDKVRFNVKDDEVRFNVKDDIYNAEKTMIKLYKLGENDKQRKQLFKVIEKFPYDFIEFLKFFPDFDNADEYINFIKKLFSRSENSLLIFFLIKTNQIDSFELYMREHQRHASGHHGYCYLTRAYLRYMRSASALKTRQKKLANSVIQSIYETRIGDQLPAAFPNDPYLPQARGIITTVNAHEHEALYQLDQPLLWKQTAAFNPVPSPTARTLYNNKLMVTENYHTNAEVEEFINYLDTTLSTGPAFALDGGRMSGDRAVSIIKQILGLEQKASNTSGGFAPYLGSSMYYAKPDSPKGDEMLGRTWHLMRNVSKSDQDLALNQRSVALGLLNSVDVCGQLVSTLCQTRTTGQLMQLVCCYLEGSHLRPVIINDRDESAATSDAAVIDRIKAAPALARSLFDSFRREDQGEIRRLIERHNEAGVEPQLWERYKAYYDMLYRRTSKASGKGYYCDENILTMDELGNMVSKYGANGWSRAAPVIIYYQAEFLVLEKVFTDLMHAEFEKKRGGYNLTHLSQPRAPESRWVRIFSNTWR